MASGQAPCVEVVLVSELLFESDVLPSGAISCLLLPSFDVCLCVLLEESKKVLYPSISRKKVKEVVKHWLWLMFFTQTC